MDRGRSIVVASTHTLSSVLLFSRIMCSWTLRHTRIAVLGFVTHTIVSTPLQSESYLYISRLVKTRDLYPGLLQFAIQSCFLILRSLPFFVSIFLFFFLFQLFSLIIDLVEVLSRPLHSKGPSVTQA
jgi:hypothetical protein